MFTPLIAHRYLQRQINEICLEFKKERNLNSQFRDEIGTVQTFKFFTQNALMDLEATLKQCVNDLVLVNKTLDKQRNDLEGFKIASGDISSTMALIDKKLKSIKNVFNGHLEKIKVEVDKARQRIYRSETDIESIQLKVNF